MAWVYFPLCFSQEVHKPKEDQESFSHVESMLEHLENLGDHFEKSFAKKNNVSNNIYEIRESFGDAKDSFIDLFGNKKISNANDMTQVRWRIGEIGRLIEVDLQDNQDLTEQTLPLPTPINLK